ncbi:hypothetical protein OAG24_01060 [bacterium]|nr:hypothetical protein [bacterium]
MANDPLCAIVIIIVVIFIVMFLCSKNSTKTEGYGQAWQYPYRNWSYSYPYRKWSYRYPRYNLSYQWGGRYPYVSAYNSPYGYWW